MGKQIKKGNFFGLSLIFFGLILWGIFSSEALAQKPIYGGTLTIALSAEPPGLDPTTSPAASRPASSIG